MKRIGLRSLILGGMLAVVLAAGQAAAEDAAGKAAPAATATPPAPAPGAKAQAAKDEPAAEAEPAPPLLELEEEGIAGIGAETPFDPMAIRQSLPPGFAVTAGSYRAGEDKELPTIHVLREDAPILSIYSDEQGRVSLIQILSPRIDVAGNRIGAAFDAFFPDPDKAECVRGLRQLSGMAICTLPDSRHINLLFDGSGREGPEDVLPPAETLADWPLKYVIWAAVQRVGARP